MIRKDRRQAKRISTNLSVRWNKLNGEVVYKVDRLGFGVRFMNVTKPDEHVLRTFIDKQGLGSSASLPFPRVSGHKH